MQTDTQRAQTVRLMAADGPSEVPSLFLGVLLGFIWATNHPYLQSSLNATWRMAGATGVTVAEQPAEPPAESAPSPRPSPIPPSAQAIQPRPP